MSTLLHGILFIWSVVFCYSSLPLFCIVISGYFHRLNLKTMRKLFVLYHRFYSKSSVKNQNLHWWFYICLCKFNLYHHVVASGSSALFFSDFTIGLFGFVGVLGTFVANFQANLLTKAIFIKFQFIAALALF